MQQSGVINERRSTVRAVRRKQHGDGYDEEMVYLYYVRAGGCVNKAFIMAAEEGERRVPRDRGTWYSCADHFDFKKRYRREMEQERREFRETMERMQMEMACELGECFQKYVKFMHVLMDRLWKEFDEGKHDVFKLLSNGSPFSIPNYDKLYRMYLRVMNLPEKITDRGQKSRSPVIFKTYTPEQKEALLRSIHQ